MDERELVKRCLEKDKLAEHELFEKFHKKFGVFLYKYFNNRDEAEDVLQEAFLRIFDNLHQFNFSGSWEGWARRIVVNHALNIIRKNKKRVIIPLSDVIEEDAIGDYNKRAFQDYNKAYAYSESEIMSMVEKLPNSYRSTFELYVLEDYSHKQVAEQMNLAEVTSRTNYRKAKIKLKNLIETHYGKRL